MTFFIYVKRIFKSLVRIDKASAETATIICVLEAPLFSIFITPLQKAPTTNKSETKFMGIPKRLMCEKR